MIRTLLRSHPYALAGFALACAVTLFFTVRILISAIYWANPAHHHESVKPWMTVGYIARSWHLDPRQLDQTSGFPAPNSPEAQGRGPLTMAEIAQLRGQTVEAVMAQANTAIAVLQAQKPPKPPSPAP